MLVFYRGQTGQTQLSIFWKVSLRGSSEHDEGDIVTEEDLQLPGPGFGNTFMEQFIRFALKKVHPSPYTCTSLQYGLCCVDVSESSGLVLVSSLTSYTPSELTTIA